MHLHQKTMRSLTIFAIFMCLTIMETSAHFKPEFQCCVQVSTQNISVPITGFKLQKENLPCVNAVIFFTEEGPKCSYWKAEWVRKKLRELKAFQGTQRPKRMTTSKPTVSPTPAL